MDKELSYETKQKKRRIKIIRYSSVLLFLLFIFWLFGYLINTPVHRSKLVIGTAKKGRIEASINAIATVIPEFEEVIISPIQSGIQKINISAGAKVDSGQSIMQLNKEFVILEYERKLDQLNLIKTQLSRTILRLENNISDLEIQRQILTLKSKRLYAVYQDAQKLLGIGSGSREEIDLARMNYEIGELELQQLNKQIGNNTEAQKAETRELELNISIEKKNVDELKRKIDHADIKSTRRGVVTWVKDEIGSNVVPGEMLARIADLSSFKIEAGISDVHAEKLHEGQDAIVRINENNLRGTIISINPSVKNGTVNFLISLNEKNSPLLRSQLKVEVFVITGIKDNAIIVPNGAAFNGSGKQALFMIENEKAYRREVVVGLSNIDSVEIVSGISEGEEVIVSDMRKH